MCSSIKTNLNIEIIFVGPVNIFSDGYNNILVDSADIRIPFKFITTSVSPVQCWQIGMNAAKGETVSITGDDATFSPYAWDKSYAMYKDSSDYKTIVSLSWFQPHKYITLEEYSRITFMDTQLENIDSSMWQNFDSKMKEFGIQLPTGCSVMSRKFFCELGGYDRRFIKRNAERDLFLRAIKNGATVKYCLDARVFEWRSHVIINPTYSSKIASREDSMLCKKKWKMEDGRLIQIMVDELFESDETFLIVSQGAKNESAIDK
jgi:hypothetical protein